jgi:multicomponent K+:H+ antiporter subunit D
VNAWLQHLPVLPIVIPLIAGAGMLLLSESQRAARVTIALTSMLGQFAAAVALLYLTTDAVTDIWTEGVGVYAIGAWPAPFGIVLVVDRLSAMMVVLGAAVALSALVYSLARWDRPGQPFHSLLQFLMMGLNGAFLTGDLFNLFVFFEVLLAASYGLMLRGLGAARVKAGLHYIVVNLAASLLFLLGVALIYGIVGTLNMADLSARAAALAPGERALFDAGLSILAVAFLVKAGSWPLNFWLPGTYSLSGAPAAAAFAMLTKVGVYGVLRIGSLMSEGDAALGPALFYIGLATLLSGTVGMLATQHLARLISYSVIVSTGTLLAALGLGIDALTAPALFYLLTSVLTTAAFFLLTGMTERTRPSAQSIPVPEQPAPPAPFYAAFGVNEPDPYRVDDEGGVAIPAAMAFLGLAFICCVLLVTGLPPLPGFIAKFAMLSIAMGASSGGEVSMPVWTLAIAVLAASFAAVIALTRIGIRLFWTVTGRTTPRLSIIEAAPVAFLLSLCVALTVSAGPVMTYLESAAASLHEPDAYIRAVLPAKGVFPERGDFQP